MVLKRHLVDLDPRATMGASLAVASLILAPVALLDVPARAPSAKALVAVIVLGLLCTAVAFSLMAVLIAEIGPGRAVVITYINPIIAVALGVAILGEQPGAGAVAGLLLILAGSWLSTDGRLPPGRLRPKYAGLIPARLRRRLARAAPAPGAPRRHSAASR
jgi:drug/metabolite transporter (DMT)-like permease